MNDATKAFLRQAYKEYYFRKADSVEFPDQLQSREFGYIPFGGGMVRHLSFKGAGEAAAEIMRQSPSSVYCSNAKYDAPTLPMENKGWRGAELIFDIDATDIPTSCKKSHDLWYCVACHQMGKLPKPPKCPKCGGHTEEHHGTCAMCLDAAKLHAMRLSDILSEDFGVLNSQTRLYFSGNRGYHVHVFDERFEHLDQSARAEIANYIRGDSLQAIQTISSILRRRPTGSKNREFGWMKWIDSYTEARMAGRTGTVQKLVSEAILSRRALIDAAVTTDIHRVFRLAGTLHGDTGMCKLRVTSPDSFDPMVDPIVLSKEPIKLAIRYSPEYTMGGTKYGAYRDTVEILPTFAAVPLLTRGFAEVA